MASAYIRSKGEGFENVFQDSTKEYVCELELSESCHFENTSISNQIANSKNDRTNGKHAKSTIQDLRANLQLPVDGEQNSLRQELVSNALTVSTPPPSCRSTKNHPTAMPCAPANSGHPRPRKAPSQSRYRCISMKKIRNYR